MPYYQITTNQLIRIIKNWELDTDCKTCHTTEPDWTPAKFDIHDNYYVLKGAHAVIADECAECHKGDYNNTPNTCFGCHSKDYSEAKEPDHVAGQFPKECESCHSESSWTPSTFNHDGLYFPIYSGKHKDQWDQCAECHKNTGDYTQFTCISCHKNPETNDEHKTVNGYSYNDAACLACHPTGDADVSFNHNSTGFPLTGDT